MKKQSEVSKVSTEEAKKKKTISGWDVLTAAKDVINIYAELSEFKNISDIVDGLFTEAEFTSSMTQTFGYLPSKPTTKSAIKKYFMICIKIGLNIPDLEPLLNSRSKKRHTALQNLSHQVSAGATSS